MRAVESTGNEVERVTRLGRVRGVERLGAHSFYGIRYGEPVARFRSPVQAGGWGDRVHDGTHFANQPWQIDPGPQSLAVFGGPEPAPNAEDCFFLNIHSPARAASSPRPVFVWIYGGGFNTGAANSYDGSSLAVSADAIVVAINYRLGLFGLADVRQLGGEFADSANLWFQDQLVALRWMRDNIEEFGGDPGNITIGGESAGAHVGPHHPRIRPGPPSGTTWPGFEPRLLA